MNDMNSQMEHLESKKDNTLTHLGENAEYQRQIIKIIQRERLIKTKQSNTKYLKEWLSS